LITCPAIMSQGMLANLIISKEIVKVLLAHWKLNIKYNY
jgi:hypothetical protein